MSLDIKLTKSMEATLETMGLKKTSVCSVEIRLIQRLSQTVLASLKRVDTHHPIFHGCIDWHSAVHGHWALLRAFKYLKRAPYLSFVLNSLNSKKRLGEECRYLDRHPLFEMPYGRAWFLRLAVEYEQVTGSFRLRRMADAVARSLLDFYTAGRPRWGVGEYQNAEWAFRQLYDYGKHTNDRRVLKFVAAHRRSLIRKAASFSLEADAQTYPEFFSRFGNYVHLLEVLARMSLFLRTVRKIIPSDKALKPIKVFKTAHHLAINYARAWGVWSLYRKTGDVRYRRAYRNHIRQGWKLHDLYRRDYYRYAHWVPQFGIYALTYPWEYPVEDFPTA